MMILWTNDPLIKRNLLGPTRQGVVGTRKARWEWSKTQGCVGAFDEFVGLAERVRRLAAGGLWAWGWNTGGWLGAALAELE